MVLISHDKGCHPHIDPQFCKRSSHPSHNPGINPCQTLSTNDLVPMHRTIQPYNACQRNDSRVSGNNSTGSYVEYKILSLMILERWRSEVSAVSVGVLCFASTWMSRKTSCQWKMVLQQSASLRSITHKHWSPLLTALWMKKIQTLVDLLKLVERTDSKTNIFKFINNWLRNEEIDSWILVPR